jgi:putative transposase
MPRQGRVNIEGGIYHVIQRGIDRCDIFRDEKDREEFIRRLKEGLEKAGHKCYGWALMPNHFHLLIRTGAKPLSELMRKLLTGYALYFNRRYVRNGYVYQNRYKSILCQEDAYLLELVRYIHLNPLRAKIVKDMDELGCYKWSGHSALIGKSNAQWQSTGEILEHFGQRRATAIERYIGYVRDGIEKGKRSDLTGGGLRRSAGGWRGVFELKRSGERWQGDERILGDGEFVSETLRQTEEAFSRKIALIKNGWTLSRLIDKACEYYKISRSDIRRKGRGNAISSAKSIIAYTAIHELGIKASEIASAFGCSGAAVQRLVVGGKSVLANERVKLLC